MFKKALISILILLLIFNLYQTLFVNKTDFSNEMLNKSNLLDSSAWVGPSHYQIPLATHKNGALIQYGYELIAHTAFYLGPKGTVQHSTNGMNCQNCHLEAGTKPWGLNYGSVFAK